MARTRTPASGIRQIGYRRKSKRSSVALVMSASVRMTFLYQLYDGSFIGPDRRSAKAHAFNMGQRFNNLEILPDDDPNTVTVRTPSNGECPPGYYLLFVLRRNPNSDPPGRLVPSDARIIQIP